MTDFSNVPCAYAPLQPRDDGFWRDPRTGLPPVTTSEPYPPIDEGAPTGSELDAILAAYGKVLNAIKDLPREHQKRVLMAATILVGVDR